MTIRVLRATISLLLAAALLAAAATPALAGTKDKAGKKELAPRAVIETIKGDKYRMANTKMAERVTRFADASGDQLTGEGLPAVDAPEYSDLVAVYVAPTRMPLKLLTKMAKDFPNGAAGSFYGRDADWKGGDRAIFVAAEMARKRPADAAGQQVEIALDGDAAIPLRVGSEGDPLAGVERFSLSGIFNNGMWGSGSTDVSGREPGGAVEYYNTSSGVFGFYDPRRSTWYVVMPRGGDVESVSVAVRTSTANGEVVDRLELPGGGHFIDLDDATGGFSKKAGLSVLTCRALETFSSAGGGSAAAEPDGTLIRYTVGVDASVDPAEARSLLAAAADATGTLPVVLTPVGSEEAPLEVDAVLAFTPAGDALTLTMEVPAGQWSFAPAEGQDLLTPAGERLFDHASLTGSAGVLTGPGLDGTVAGDPTCGAAAVDSGAGSTAAPDDVTPGG